VLLLSHTLHLLARLLSHTLPLLPYSYYTSSQSSLLLIFSYTVPYNIIIV
jgi:hypothetical protein